MVVIHTFNPNTVRQVDICGFKDSQSYIVRPYHQRIQGFFESEMKFDNGIKPVCMNYKCTYMEQD